MKCLEKIVKNVLCEQVKTHTDCHQFAYTKGRCVDDATLSLTDYVLKFVDKPNGANKKHFVKILFVDFSSAFNTIQPHLMMEKLNAINVNPYIILWVNEFLTSRSQYVKYLGVKSESIITNTGAPQGCVLSPILFTLYTGDCRCSNACTQLFKYADDTALVGRCVNNDTEYRQEVERFVTWCSSNYLELNVKKTKEMIVDFRKIPCNYEPLIINNEAVEIVHSYKYLGTIIDNRFNFNEHVEKLYKKGRSRMYFIRQLVKLNIDNKILELFYTSVVQSVITFSITCWFGNCSMESKNKLSRIIKQCSKLGVPDVASLPEIFKKCALHRCITIYKDTVHPLSCNYRMLPSGRRLQCIKCRTSRYAKSFIPSSIVLINNGHLSSL